MRREHAVTRPFNYSGRITLFANDCPKTMDESGHGADGEVLRFGNSRRWKA